MNFNKLNLIILVAAAAAILAVVWLFVPQKTANENELLANTDDTNTTLNANTAVTNTNASTGASIYLVAIGDNGLTGSPIGCGDSLVPVTGVINVSRPDTDQATVAAITAVLDNLFSIHDKNYGQSGLYNSLYQSQLTVGSVTVSFGLAKVSLTGSLKLGGTCDSPRASTQIIETIKQFPDITETTVTLNGKTLDEALSQK